MPSAREFGAIVPAFLYRCPITNQHVQGWLSDEVANDVLRPVVCIACQRTHLIDAKTGQAQKANRDLPG
jgi:hypothetical protein